jgi:hypothetical protein
VPVGYLRGLDGIVPGASSAPANASSAPRGQRPSAEDMLMEQVIRERADGPSQYDYLRRLAARLVDLDRSERKAGRHGVAAIGILGSDAYDKILVLDALRDRFPKAVFFAADLDARLLDAGAIGSTRNLVVASGYGLTLTRELQGSAPPFRDTYQTGTYLSTLVALDPDASGLSTSDFKPWFRDSRLYEIGRTQPVNLVGARRDGRNGESTPGPERGDCLTPDPSRCKFIHSDEDWRSFDPLPNWRGGIAMLLMAVAALGLAIRLSRKARTVTSGPWSYVTPLGAGVVAFGFVVLVAGLYAIHRNVHSPDGEPFAWLEGVSIWPTQILGLAILFVTSVLFVYGRMRLRTNIDEVAETFGLETLEERERNAGRGGRVGAVRRGHWRSSPAIDETMSRAGPGTVAEAWSDFLERMRFKACAARVVVATLLFLVFGIALMSLDWPNSPHRGAEAAWFNHGLQVVLIGVVMALLFSAVDASTVATHFLRRVLTIAVDPPLLQPVLPGTASDELIGERARGHWTRFRLAVEVAAAVNRLVYLPFVALLLLAPVRSRVFDAWEFSVPYAALLVISLVIAVRCAMGLRRQAARLRSRVLTELDAEADQREIEAKLATVDAGTGVGSPVAAGRSVPPELQATLLRRLATDIRAVRDGPFRPLSQEPVVRGLLLVLGGTGGITTAEFLFLSH